MGLGGRVCGPAHGKVGVTDSLGIKSLHAHLVHWGEVGLDHVDTFHVSLNNRFNEYHWLSSVIGHYLPVCKGLVRYRQIMPDNGRQPMIFIAETGQNLEGLTINMAHLVFMLFCVKHHFKAPFQRS